MNYGILPSLNLSDYCGVINILVIYDDVIIFQILYIKNKRIDFIMMCYLLISSV